ncbi:MAG: M56 family metallopeptidase [Acidothermales bacterium]|nr:M56 family metallopeptidase [Acidothermales bacterium]
MRVDIYLPLLLTGVFGLVAPGIARRLPPAIAAWLLSIGGLVCAAASGATLAFLGWTLVGQSPDVAADGHWSVPALRNHDLVPRPVAGVALAAFGIALTWTTVLLVRRLRALADAYRLAGSLASHDGQLVVTDDDSLPACAVPGRPGRVIVPAGLLRRLDATERRALLAHERAHIAHRHHLHGTAVALAAAANPMLRRLPAAVALATERWADEDAARHTRRDAVARALRTAALTSRTVATPGSVLGAVGSDVVVRVAALTAPPPRPTAWRILALTAIVAATALATLVAARETERLFELAMHVYRLTH